MADFELAPGAPCGSKDGVGDVPDFGQADLIPKAPREDFNGFPDSSGDTLPAAPKVTGEMPLNLGKSVQAL